MSGTKKTIAVFVIVIVFCSALYIGSTIVQARRERAYHQALAPFQRDLHTGMMRSEVQTYLDARKVTYRQIFWGGSGAPS